MERDDSFLPVTNSIITSKANRTVATTNKVDNKIIGTTTLRIATNRRKSKPADCVMPQNTHRQHAVTNKPSIELVYRLLRRVLARSSHAGAISPSSSSKSCKRTGASSTA